MKKLEQYLDQVCRRIGGPRALRQHVRQELREHLLDAMAQHKAAGLPEQAALERALAEFGEAEEVRSELEGTHGQRLLAVVIEKAMQWQERTMKAKWLWTTWAYLVLGLLIVLQALFLTFTNVFIVPRFELLTRGGYVDRAILEQHDLSWTLAWLNNLHELTGSHTALVLLLAAVAIGLFEWRVRSENKTLIRVAALGTVAVTLMMVSALMTGSMLVAFELGAPPVSRMTRLWAVEQADGMSKSLGAIEQALTKKDWPEVEKQAEAAATCLRRLSQGPALASLTQWNEAPSVEDLRAQLKLADEELRAVQQASAAKDTSRLETALRRLQEAWSPLQAAASRPPD
jgi:uncharacterized membrane protein